MKETWVWSLGQKDPLEKEVATKYSCLENPMDRGVWQTTIYGGHKNWTQLKAQHLLVLRQLHAKIQKEMFSFSISEQKKKKKERKMQ